MPRRRQLVALLLAVAYGVIAVAGHGLHALAPCGDSDCCDQAVATCSCGHTHAAKEAPSDHDPRAFRAPRDTSHHNPHSCAFCTLLAKVKVGHAESDHSAGDVAVVDRTIPFASPTKVATAEFSYAPRGPPMGV